MQKLWDYDHPYYMNEGCYYQSGCLEYFDSFDSFLEEWKNQDVDLNRIHRWDIGLDTKTLDLFYVMQRKAYTYSVHIKIDPEKDHDRIKKFLKPHAELNKKLWEGVLE